MKEVAALVDKIVGLVCPRGSLADWDHGTSLYAGFPFVRTPTVVNSVHQYELGLHLATTM